MLDTFAEFSMSSTYWVWRSYHKGGRDVFAPEWGFELVHNDGPHEALDAHMLAVLQRGFVKTSRAHPANLEPCGGAASLDVTGAIR